MIMVDRLNMKKLNSGTLYQRIFITIILASVVLWAIFIFAGGVNSSQTSAIADVDDFWADYINPTGYAAYLSPYDNEVARPVWHKQQPPLAYVVFYCFSRLTDNMQTYYDAHSFLNMYQEPLYLFMFVLFWMLVTIIIFESVRKYTDASCFVKMGMAFSVILSFPLIHNMERGNHIFWILPLVMFYFFNYDSEDKKRRELALISLALAAGLKMTPALFGVLLLVEKRWKESIRCILYGLAAILLPFLFLDGGFANIPLWIRNVRMNGRFDSGLYNAVRGIFDTIGIGWSDGMETVMSIASYVVLAALIFGAIKFRRKFEKVLCISMLFIATPGHAGVYDLIVLFPAMIMFFNEKEHKKKDILLLLAFLFICVLFRIDCDWLPSGYMVGILLIAAYVIAACVPVVKNMIVTKLEHRKNAEG